mmetsp:Transcript_19152/g.32191  ORF Transcript_19152/g.32191 Transcript_19152/m.32191 type:complete len:227 (-) Transcript_19152:196-876(-)
MPTMGKNASKNAIIKKAEELFLADQPEESSDGKRVTLSLRKKLETLLLADPSIIGEENTVYVQVVGDGASLMKGVGQVTWAFKLLPKKSKRGSAKPAIKTHATLVYEGKEEYEVMLEAIERMFTECKDLYDNGLQLDGREAPVTIHFLGGGDYKILAESVCHQGAGALWPCLWCLINTYDMGKLDLASILRTIEQMQEHGHVSHEGLTFPHTCIAKDCKETFASAK